MPTNVVNDNVATLVDPSHLTTSAPQSEPLEYIKLWEMKEYMRSYMTEAKWRNEGYTPTIEEHMSIALISSDYKFPLKSSLVGMGDKITDRSNGFPLYLLLSKFIVQFTGCRMI